MARRKRNGGIFNAPEKYYLSQRNLLAREDTTDIKTVRAGVIGSGHRIITRVRLRKIIVSKCIPSINNIVCVS